MIESMLSNIEGHPCCIMCGSRIFRKPQRSAVTLKAARDFLSARCVITGFHYATVMQMQGDETCVGICSMCRGWKRRVLRHRCVLKKHLTPFDAVIKVVLAPGTTPDLDQRNWYHVVCAVLNKDNLFADVLPLPVRTILTEMLKTNKKSDHRSELAHAWFSYNEKPEFFNHGKVAAVMRKFAVKKIERSGVLK